MSLQAVRQALADQLVTLDALRVYYTVPDNPEVPCAIIYPEEIDYLNDFTDIKATFIIEVLTSSVISEGGQNQLDAYVDWDGTSSIPELLHGTDLAGTVASAIVTRMRNYGISGEQPRYFSAQLLVEVLA